MKFNTVERNTVSAQRGEHTPDPVNQQLLGKNRRRRNKINLCVLVDKRGDAFVSSTLLCGFEPIRSHLKTCGIGAVIDGPAEIRVGHKILDRRSAY